MPTTPNLALRYPAATDAPDGPGALLALATDVDNALAAGTWTPALGGTGAAMGANAFGDGTLFRLGKHCIAKGRIVFGSSASFGTGTATITSLPAAIDTAHSTGYGLFIPVTGPPVPVLLHPADGANMYIRVVQSTGSGSAASTGAASAIGTPAQSSQLMFTLDLTFA